MSFAVQALNLFTNRLPTFHHIKFSISMSETLIPIPAKLGMLNMKKVKSLQVSTSSLRAFKREESYFEQPLVLSQLISLGLEGIVPHQIRSTLTSLVVNALQKLVVDFHGFYNLDVIKYRRRSLIDEPKDWLAPPNTKRLHSA
jgi:hypothetical protein